MGLLTATGGTVNNVRTRAARQRAAARSIVLLVVTALVLGAMTTLAAGQVKIGPTVKAAGVGTEAAKNAPYCDPKDGRLAIPYQKRPPCVRPMKQGESNGGATSPGVTKNAIKIVAVVPTPEQQRATWSNVATPPPVNHATNSPGYVEDAVTDWLTVLTRSFQTWGRTIVLTVFNPTGPTEEAQRADALAVAAMNPFAVLVSNQTTGAGTVFTAEIAAKKILIFTSNGTNADAAQQAPYRWQGVFDNDASAVNGAQFIGQMLVGETAKWAGDPAMKTKTRVFGAIYPERNLNFDLFLKGFAKYKGAKLTEKVQYTVPLDPALVQPQNQSEAPILMAKLKAAGVTSVIAYASGPMTSQAMKAATALDYYPEWIFPGLGILDLDVIVRSYDQAQMAHAFGVGTLLVNVADTTDPSNTYFDWYWGTNKGTYQAGVLSYLQTFLTGVMLAGPKLTPANFQQGLFALPAAGGAASDQTQSYMTGFGRQAGLPYDEFSSIGLDYALMWWDPNTVGKSKITFTEGKGVFQYLNQAKRYRAGDWPKGEPKFFDPTVSITQFATFPTAEIPPTYPCKGCPSTKS
jgi:hypothetical protein